jgi:hypothetical protein
MGQIVQLPVQHREDVEARRVQAEREAQVNREWAAKRKREYEAPLVDREEGLKLARAYLDASEAFWGWIHRQEENGKFRYELGMADFYDTLEGYADWLLEGKYDNPKWD